MTMKNQLWSTYSSFSKSTSTSSRFRHRIIGMPSVFHQSLDSCRPPPSTNTIHCPSHDRPARTWAIAAAPLLAALRATPGRDDSRPSDRCQSWRGGGARRASGAFHRVLRRHRRTVLAHGQRRRRRKAERYGSTHGTSGNQHLHV